MRRFGAALAVALLAVLGALASAAPAWAHNVMVSSDPASGARLDTAPTAVTFTFDQAIENFEPALKVFGPNGNEFTTAAPTVEGNSVSAPMAAGPAGDYRAVYRIVSADGHPVTGEITFTLTESAAGTATGIPAPLGEAAPTTEGSPSTGLGVWLWVIVGAAAVLVAVAIVIAVRGPRDKR